MIIVNSQTFHPSLSVKSSKGYRKVSLIEADNRGELIGNVVEIDATTDVNVTLSKSVMQHSAESRRVYMDGTKINPTKMSINGHIDSSKLQDLQRFVDDDVWFYVSLTKDMGGALINTITQVLSDCKIYVATNLSIRDEGFKNTVEISLELTEVVLFEYGIEYKYGIKQNKPSSSNVQQAGLKEEKPEDPFITTVPIPK